jgi:hypothetical protein
MERGDDVLIAVGDRKTPIRMDPHAQVEVVRTVRTVAERLDALRANFERRLDDLLSLRMDVSSKAQLATMAEVVASRFSALDVLTSSRMADVAVEVEAARLAQEWFSLDPETGAIAARLPQHLVRTGHKAHEDLVRHTAVALDHFTDRLVDRVRYAAGQISETMAWRMDIRSLGIVIHALRGAMTTVGADIRALERLDPEAPAPLLSWEP